MSIFFIFKNFEHQNFKPQVGTSLTVYLQITFLYIYIYVLEKIWQITCFVIILINALHLNL